MDKETFTRAAERNSRRLYLIALSFTGNHADAEDMLQNTLLKLWQRAKAFTDEQHMDKWLTAVCVNECKSLLRSLRRAKNTALEEAQGLFTFDTPRDLQVFAAVMALPAKERIVIHLFYYEDLSVNEIAKALGISAGAAKTRLSRARKTLKEKLGDEY